MVGFFYPKRNEADLNPETFCQVLLKGPTVRLFEIITFMNTKGVQDLQQSNEMN